MALSVTSGERDTFELKTSQPHASLTNSDNHKQTIVGNCSSEYRLCTLTG